MSSKCSMALSVLALSSTWASEVYLTDESEDSAGAPHRIKIPPFTLTFYPANGLMATQGDLVEELAEDALRYFFPTKLGEGVTVDYVDLTIHSHTLTRRQLQDNATEVLQIAGGIASFRGGEPTLDEVNAWVSEALEGDLLELLREEADLNTLEGIVFDSLTSAPTPAPAAFTISTSNSTQSNSTQTAGVVASVVAGIAFFAVVILATLWMRRRRRREYVDFIDDGSDAAVKGLPPCITDVAAESDEENTPETDVDSGPKVVITVQTVGQNLPEDGDAVTLPSDQHLVKSDDTEESISHSLSTLSTHATQIQPAPQQGEPGSGLLCALQVIDGACLCHVSTKK